MKLKYGYEVKKRKISIELETADFTPKENTAISMLGEPVVSFQKTYPGGYTISLSKKIQSQFKTKIVIDGTSDVEKANEAGQQFLEDIAETLENTMEKLMESYEDQIFPPKQGAIQISDYR